MASVADLVEPLVLGGGDLPGDVREEATRLHDAGAVTLDAFGPVRVTASVADDGHAFDVALASAADGLESACSCAQGSSGLICAHSLATAIVTWERAPRRRS